MFSLEPYGISDPEDAYDHDQEVRRYAEAKALARELYRPTIPALAAVLAARYDDFDERAAEQLAFDALNDLFDDCTVCGRPSGALTLVNDALVCDLCRER